MIGRQPCDYACSYVDPVLTGQNCDIGINISKSTRTIKHDRSSCGYTYANVAGVLTCLCVCLYLCSSENQPLVANWMYDSFNKKSLRNEHRVAYISQ